ncbi:MAG TPA: M48 family metallopeptidase [Dysgonamonadaceae bacterium]|nr:M48 family metallopeptidase [Dysgonamonadaceae bacterium]
MNDFLDKELGPVVVKRNSRAKKVIVRRKHNAVEMTVPARMTQSEIKKHFNDLKPQILKLPVKEVIKITEESEIKTFTFDVAITRKSLYNDKIDMSLKEGIVTIDVPAQYDIEQEYVQMGIKSLIIHALRHEAKRVLPYKVASFAKKLNLQVGQVKINNSKQRWGSCSNKKNINLSLFLMMMPEHLIDYVILHELAHTIELNHSPRFWQLLDKFCDGKAQELDRESTYWNSDYLYWLKQ